MSVFRDYCGVAVRLTDERKSHILEHPEMADLEWAIGETLANPEIVSESPADTTASCTIVITSDRVWVTSFFVLS